MYRAGLVSGALASVIVLGIVKDVWALLKPSGEGILVFGFLMLRYSSQYRVWFGYGLTGRAAWYGAILHVILYAAGAYGLVTRRRWGWMLVAAYLPYVLVSEALYALLGGFGLFGRPIIPSDVLRAHIPYYVLLVGLVALVEWTLWKYRDVYVR
jgi:hypothetical protein